MSSGIYKRPTQEERFWKYVQKGKPNECWLWIGCVFKKRRGYGQFFSGKHSRAHRFSYELHYGKIPDGLMVLHHCDNPPCVNPRHLFCGTAKENTEDMIKKGRMSKGEKHPISKLTEKQVVEIRKIGLSGKLTQGEIGKKFGVSNITISDIMRNKKWKI
jgi:hypothetical protein